MKYDLIVIGAGSGLDVADAVASRYGWKVALIEKGPMGGTCLNRGCIPSKIIINSAEVVDSINKSSKFGISASINSIDFNKVISRASKYVDEQAKQIEESILLEHKIDLYKNTAEFLAPKRLWVGDKEIDGDRVLIAAGSRPNIPPLHGIDTVDYITSTEALRLTKLPKSMIIIGGGYISAELGNFYSKMGTDVTIIQRGERLLEREDIDISTAFTNAFSKNIKVLLKTNIKSVKKKANGTKVVFIQNGVGGEREIATEVLLVATGTKPNSDLLKLNNTKIKTTEKGYIEVNEFMETSEENVWALGDIVGKAPFKHGANWEAKHVYRNIKGDTKVAVDYSIMPHAVFSSPQVAGVGITEQQAKDRKISYKVKKAEYKNTGMGKALEEDGFVKFIVDSDNRKVLGCHIIGHEASILIHEVVVLLKAGQGSISGLRDAIHIHPSLNEVVQRAL